MNVDASYDNHWGKTETWIHLLEGMANPRMAQQRIPGRSGRTQPRLQQQVLEEERRRNTAVRAELASFPVQDGRTANLWTGTFSCDFWSQFAEVRVSAVQIGKEHGEVGEQPLVVEPASLLLTFGDTPVLQHFSTQPLNSGAPKELSCISRLHLMAIAN